MRATVAVVETRPETVAEDLARVLGLAGFPRRPELAARLVVGAGPAGGWCPGAATTPWQLGAACDRFAPGAAPLVLGLDERGSPAPRPDPLLVPVLRRAGAVWADGAAWQRRPVRTTTALPHLEAVAGGHPTAPAVLIGEPVALLPAPAVGRGWPVAGAVALLAGLLAPPRPREWRARPAASLVEIVRLARECLHVAGALMDGTSWSVSDGPGRRAALQGNVLLAARDPVALDAVACALAGADPRRVPWLRACAQAGVGNGDPRDIRLAGRTDLDDLGFALPGRVLAPAPRLPVRRSLRGAAWRWWGRRALLRRHRDTPWGRLRAANAESGVRT